MPATTSDIVSPAKGLRPDNISNSTQPKAQMSVRLSTGLPARLLRAHVGGRAQDRCRRACGPRAVIVGASPSQLPGPGVERLGQTEVEDLDASPSGVTLMFAGFRSRWMMPLLVRGLERLGHLPGERERLVERQRAVADALGERRPFDELDDQRANAIGLLDAVDRGDVRMIE